MSDEKQYTFPDHFSWEIWEAVMEWLFPNKGKDMKQIIEVPILNRAELTCSFCGCKFSFDISDVDY